MNFLPDHSPDGFGVPRSHRAEPPDSPPEDYYGDDEQEYFRDEDRDYEASIDDRRDG